MTVSATSAHFSRPSLPAYAAEIANTTHTNATTITGAATEGALVIYIQNPRSGRGVENQKKTRFCAPDKSTQSPRGAAEPADAPIPPEAHRHEPAGADHNRAKKHSQPRPANWFDVPD